MQRYPSSGQSSNRATPLFTPMFEATTSIVINCLFSFDERRLPPSFFCQSFQSHQIDLSAILEWSNGNSRNLRDLAIEVLCKNTRFKREFRAGGGGSQGRKRVRRLRGNLSKKRQVQGTAC